ncbi:MAG TPA: thiamine-phosphate kinase [Burkholderiaceae bacterium]|nr:thiamine-phosphate kinase [Burkholderiaceae bacterium]
MSRTSGEFELIARYFAGAARNDAVELGIGDDCALIDAGPGRQWAVTTDMLVEGVHFLSEVAPEALGHKALAVNLSDLAACGAQPRCYFLAIALPSVDETWLSDFTRGMLALGDHFGCSLAGGDTTRSREGVTISITALGEVPRGRALLRSGARAGDDLWVSGHLGDGALGLALLRDGVVLPPAERSAVIERLERPVPRVALGIALRGVARSAIDVSDGLAGDLGHILERSGVGARVEWREVPMSSALRRMPPDLQRRCVLAGGDDYELLFTADPAMRDGVLDAGRAAELAVTRIGNIVAEGGLTLIEEDGRRVDIEPRAFDHFRP